MFMHNYTIIENEYYFTFDSVHFLSFIGVLNIKLFFKTCLNIKIKVTVLRSVIIKIRYRKQCSKAVKYLTLCKFMLISIILAWISR